MEGNNWCFSLFLSRKGLQLYCNKTNRRRRSIAFQIFLHIRHFCIQLEDQRKWSQHFFLTFFSFETAVNVICQLVKVSSRADKRHNSDSYNIAVRKAFDAVAGRELRLRHIHINISLTWETVGLSLLVKENLNLDDFIVT